MLGWGGQKYWVYNLCLFCCSQMPGCYFHFSLDITGQFLFGIKEDWGINCIFLPLILLQCAWRTKIWLDCKVLLGCPKNAACMQGLIIWWEFCWRYHCWCYSSYCMNLYKNWEGIIDFNQIIVFFFLFFFKLRYLARSLLLCF